MCLGGFDLFLCLKCAMDFDLRALPTPHPGTATSTASNMPSSTRWNTQAKSSKSQIQPDAPSKGRARQSPLCKSTDATRFS